ncbi:MAG TPA: hypothetical protein VNO18_06905, partial [Xanthobacteraceae bacterium]|nr:hypothetical protein [Xanthobacteraceae bacterium]
TFAVSNNVGVEKSRKHFSHQWLMPTVRSEGGEDGSNLNNLPRWAKREVHFAPIGAFQAQRQN